MPDRALPHLRPRPLEARTQTVTQGPASRGQPGDGQALRASMAARRLELDVPPVRARDSQLEGRARACAASRGDAGSAARRAASGALGRKRESRRWAATMSPCRAL